MILNHWRIQRGQGWPCPPSDFSGALIPCFFSVFQSLRKNKFVDLVNYWRTCDIAPSKILLIGALFKSPLVLALDSPLDWAALFVQLIVWHIVTQTCTCNNPQTVPLENIKRTSFPHAPVAETYLTTIIITALNIIILVRRYIFPLFQTFSTVRKHPISCLFYFLSTAFYFLLLLLLPQKLLNASFNFYYFTFYHLLFAFSIIFAINTSHVSEAIKMIYFIVT